MEVHVDNKPFPQATPTRPTHYQLKAGIGLLMVVVLVMSLAFALIVVVVMLLDKMKELIVHYQLRLKFLSFNSYIVLQCSNGVGNKHKHVYICMFI